MQALNFQQYLKVRLNCVLMTSAYGKNSDINEDQNIECVDLESDNEYNELFSNMESFT